MGMTAPTSHIARAEAILLACGRHSELSVGEICQETGIPQSSAYRILTSLVDTGLLQKTQHSRYGAGPVTVQLAERYKENALIKTHIGLELSSLSDQTGEMAAYMVVNGKEAVCIQTAESKWSLRCSYTIGASQPLIKGATATMLLSMQSDEFIDSVIDFYDLSPAHAQQLRADITQARDDGYAVSQGALDPGIWGASAPVVSDEGNLFGVITVMAPVARTQNKQSQIIRQVRTAAHHMSGGRR